LFLFLTDLKHDFTADIVQLFAKKSEMISDYFLKLNVLSFHTGNLEAHIPLHCHPEYWWGYSH